MAPGMGPEMDGAKELFLDTLPLLLRKYVSGARRICAYRPSGTSPLTPSWGAITSLSSLLLLLLKTVGEAPFSRSVSTKARPSGVSWFLLAVVSGEGGAGNAAASSSSSSKPALS